MREREIESNQIFDNKNKNTVHGNSIFHREKKPAVHYEVE